MHREKERFDYQIREKDKNERNSVLLFYRERKSKKEGSRKEGQEERERKKEKEEEKRVGREGGRERRRNLEAFFLYTFSLFSYTVKPDMGTRKQRLHHRLTLRTNAYSNPPSVHKSSLKPSPGPAGKAKVFPGQVLDSQNAETAGGETTPGY